jgi:hypothetical protein
MAMRTNPWVPIFSSTRRAIVVRLVAYTVNIVRFFTAWASTERIHVSPVSGFR